MKTVTKNVVMLAEWHGGATGFATVSRNLLNYFLPHHTTVGLSGNSVPAYNIILVAINYYGETYKEDNLIVVSARDYFIPNGSSPDPMGRYSMCHVLANNDIDLLFVVYDYPVIKPIIPELFNIKNFKKTANKRSFKSVLYTPVDRELFAKDVYNIEFFDTIIAYNEFGKTQICKYKPELKTKTKIIPHGINTNEFYKLSIQETINFRIDFFGKENSDKFIFCNVNRNQPRKSIGDTILSFIELKKLIRDEQRQPFLYLHMLGADAAMNGYELKSIFAQTELVEGKDYKIAPQEFFKVQNGCSIEQLNKIYNACDCYVSTTLGEGWGLTAVEAMACGLRIIVPDHTSFTEICNFNKDEALHRGYGCNINLTPFISPFDSAIRWSVDIYDFADEMAAILLNEKADFYTVSNNAKKYIATLSWKNIANDFIKYFNELLK